MKFFLFINTWLLVFPLFAHAQYQGTSTGNVILQVQGGEVLRIQSNKRVLTHGPVKLNAVSTCNSSSEGVLRYNSADETMDLCDGTNWIDMLINEANLAPDATVGAVAASDTTPNSLVFTDTTDVSYSEVVYSDVVTISGVDSPGVIVHMDDLIDSFKAQININGGGWEDIDRQIVSSGDTVQLSYPYPAYNGNLTNSKSIDITMGMSTTTWTMRGYLPTRIFATNSSYNGNLGGLSGADAICQANATSNGYSGTWIAFLSDSTTSIASRLTNMKYPVVRANDGLLIDPSNLFDGFLDGGVALSPSRHVWTGSNVNGTSHSDNCNNWTANAYPAYGQYGQGDEYDDWWISYSNRACNNTYKLICISND